MPSTFTSGYVQDNEIVKTEDIQFGFESIVENATKMAAMILESTQDFIINGKIKTAGGMKLVVSPIFGVCHSTGKAFGCITESPCTTDGSISYLTLSQGGTLDRIDIIEAKSEWQSYDTQQRAFRDLDTKTDTIQQTDTKQHLNVIYRVLAGTEGSSIAPSTEPGWVKIAEIHVPANAEELSEYNIKNVTADIEGEENQEWTNEKNNTYNIGYISDVNERFRQEHDKDGKHKENIISTKELNIGIGSKQINGTVLPIGAIIDFANQSTESTESIKSTFAKIADLITQFYNFYLKFGKYNFNGILALSDSTKDGDLIKPFKIEVITNDSENKSVNFYLNERKIFTITENGILQGTEDYQAKTPLDFVTKSVTDAITQTINNLTKRISQLEETSDVTIYSNNTLSRFSVDNSISVAAATESNIEFSGLQIIDGVSVSPGDIVLVKAQADTKENGFYEVSSSIWSRKTGYVTTSSIKEKLWQIKNGIKNKGKIFYCPKVNFTQIDFGTDEIPFSEYLGSIAPLNNKVALRDESGHVKSKPAQEQNDCLIKADLLNLIYPVGTYYWNSKDTAPEILFGGKWEQIQGRAIIAAGTATDENGNEMTFNAGETGGNYKIQLTESQLPEHKHKMDHTHKFTPTGYIDSHRHGERLNIDNNNTPTGNVDNYTSPLITALGTTGTAWTGPLGGYQQGLWVDDPRRNLYGYQILTDATQPAFHGYESNTNSASSINTDNTGLGTSFSIQTPYEVAYCWKRIA